MALERRWTLLIGALQGMLLLVAHELHARDLLPATELPVLLAWCAFVVVTPLTAQLLAQEGTRRRVARCALVFGLVLAALGAYAGYAAGEGVAEDGNLSWMRFCFSGFVAWFIAMPFATLWVRRGRPGFPYEELFAAAWSHALTLGFGALFCGIFWALLGLWSQLFDVIGIEFFGRLFTRREFVWPATTLAFSFALSLGRSHGDAVAIARKVMLSLGRAVLPLLSLITILFLLALPLTGLAALWSTGLAAVLLLATQVSMILFVNAAWQDGRAEAPFGPWVQRGVTVAIILLPLFSGLTLYALALRVMQHGWTGDRVWASLAAGVVALYAIGYAGTALRRRGPWLGGLGSINKGLALLLVAVVVIADTPLLDPMRIGAESQMNRLLQRRVSAEEFDFLYLRFDAGRYGIQALNHLAEQGGDPEAEAMRAAAKSALALETRWAARHMDAAQVLAHVTVFPEGRGVSPGLAQLLANEGDPGATRCAQPQEDCMLLAVDLDRDGSEEYVELFWPYGVFTRDQEGWRRVGRIQAQGAWDPVETRAALERRNYGVTPPHWAGLQVGERRYQVIEERGDGE